MSFNRNTIVAAAVTAAAFAGTAAVGVAAPSSPGGASTSTAQAATRQFEGTVLSVNRSARTFRLRDSERGTVTIRVTSRTRFERVSGFSSLRRGLTGIEATVRRSNGRWVATAVERSGGGGQHGGGGRADGDAGDISGPCDEAEHANDSRCTGVPPAPSGGAVQPGVDISGPCDEAEHANDPRCTGVPPAPSRGAVQPGVDISGPCDEAEHANDPRCTGASSAVGRDDSSGPGRGGHGRH